MKFLKWLKKLFINPDFPELDKLPVPKGLEVRHSCDNPPCVNPAHLSVGTRSDNMLDSVQRGRQLHTRKTHCPQGHSYAEHGYVGKTNRRYCDVCQSLKYWLKKKIA